MSVITGKGIISGVLSVIRHLPGGHELQIPLDVEVFKLYLSHRSDVLHIMRNSARFTSDDDFLNMKSCGIEVIDDVSFHLGCDAVDLVNTTILSDYFNCGLADDSTHE